MLFNLLGNLEHDVVLQMMACQLHCAGLLAFNQSVTRRVGLWTIEALIVEIDATGRRFDLTPSGR